MVKVFYDGCGISTYASYPNVVGFTTNTTIMRQAKQFNYKTFYEAHKDLIDGRPISFQIFSDEPEVIVQQARLINELGTNIYVKVPVITSQGESLLPTIKSLLQEGIQVNITAVFTYLQIDDISTMLSSCTSTTKAIISVFGGRISDTGIEPRNIIRHAVQSVRDLTWVEILWAGVKDNLVIQYANEIGCHIVTVPDAIISRLNRIGQPLDTLSQDTVASFLKDGVELSIV